MPSNKVGIQACIHALLSRRGPDDGFRMLLEDRPAEAAKAEEGAKAEEAKPAETSKPEEAAKPKETGKAEDVKPEVKPPEAAKTQ